jgi:circadian clock protein KaiC
MKTGADHHAQARVCTGISGLDEILPGGLPAHRLYLIEGMPGTGKTTLALQFLIEGRRGGERGLYVTLSETKEELQEVAESHGWSLDGIDLYELGSSEARLKPDQEYTVFYPEEVELTETAQSVYQEVERINPSRVVFDSLSEMRLLARDPLRYRRQILSLKQFFAGRHCTVLLLDDTVGRNSDLQLQSISHGVLSLERLGQEYGISRRRMNVVKLRGSKFRDGYHDYLIDTGGIRVFPRLVAAEHRQARPSSVFVSGIRELDDLLGGGLSSGTSTLITGPAGSGNRVSEDRFCGRPLNRDTMQRLTCSRKPGRRIWTAWRESTWMWRSTSIQVGSPSIRSIRRSCRRGSLPLASARKWSTNVRGSSSSIV